MEQTKTINKINSLFLAKFFILAGILFFAPLLKNQMITGTIVNLIFFLGVIMLGRNATLSLCVFPSIISLFSGLLPVVMAPFLPFIIIGNMILVLVFDFLKKNQYLAVIFSSLLKFLFLFLSSSFMIKFFSVNPKIAIMFSYPQFFTALAGGFLAILILKIINNNKKNDI